MEQVKSGKLTLTEALSEAEKMKHETHGNQSQMTSKAIGRGPPASPRINTINRNFPSPSPTSRVANNFFASDKMSESPKEISVISAPVIPIELQQNPFGTFDRKMSVQSAASHGSEGEYPRMLRQESFSKTGDSERVEIFELVKSGRMTINDAVDYLNNQGLGSSAKREADTIADTRSAITEQKCYNFAVYKSGRFKAQVRRILQIDFKNKVICNIQRGNVMKKYNFAQVHDYDSKEDDVYFKILFNDNTETDMDADSPEEKNEILRLLSVIIKLNTGDVRSELDVTESLPKLQTVIKEGQLEKKGKGFNPWAKRWLRVRFGEVSYYRPDEETALNIIQLAEGTTAVTRVDRNGFIIIKKSKQFEFRVPTEDRTAATIEQEREKWVKVILEASHGERHQSAVTSPQLPLAPQFGDTLPNLSVPVHQLCQELSSMMQQLQCLQVPASVLGQAERAFQMAQRMEQAGLPTVTVSGASELPGESTERMSAEDKKIYAAIKKQQSKRLSDQRQFGDAQTIQVPDPLGDDDSADEAGYSKIRPGEAGEYIPSIDIDVAELIPASEGRLKPVPKPRRTQSIPEDVPSVEGKTDVAITPITKPEKLGEESAATDQTLDQQTHETSPPAPSSAPSAPVPPPPPPSFFERMMTPSKKLKQTSKTKLKVFHWNKVPKNLYNKSSLWKSAADLTDKLDVALLAEVFSATQDVPNTPTAKSPEKKQEKTSLLDMNRRKNLEIVLMGFKMSVDQLESKLNFIKESEGALLLDQVGMLRRLQPTSDDIEMYKNYKGSRDSLQKADRFMMQLCEIPNLNLRLDALVAIMELPSQVEELEPTITNMAEACGELSHSAKLKNVLEYVLATGNILNHSSKKDVADGFDMSSLTKLADLKGRDKKYNLLQFVIEQMAKHDEGLLRFFHELSHVEACCDISIKGLNAEIEVMTKDLNKIRNNAEKVLKKRRGSLTAFDKKFQRDVQEYVSEYEKKLKSLNEDCLKAQALFKNTLEYFGENPEKDSQEFFSYLAEFIKKFKVVVTEHEKAKNQSSPNPNRALADAFTRGLQKQTKSFDFGMLSKANVTKGTSQDCHTKEGFLEKLSGGKLWSAKWDKRWFEVSSTGHLHYSKKKGDKNLGSVYLRRCPIKLEEEDNTIIFIDTEERDFKIKAKTAEEAQDWFTVLCYYGDKQ